MEQPVCNFDLCFVVLVWVRIPVKMLILIDSNRGCLSCSLITVHVSCSVLAVYRVTLQVLCVCNTCLFNI